MPAAQAERVEQAVVVDGLRRWARGAYAEEAAVELLARAFGGRYANAGCSWVRPCDAPGWYWLDGEPLLHDTGCLSGGERRLLAVAGAVVTGLALRDLGGVMCGLDRPNQALVLAALAHAGGSHEHTGITEAPGGHRYARLRPLAAWPEDLR